MRRLQDEELKPSWVELLAMIPQGWEINKIGRIVKFFTGATPPTGDTASYEGDKMWANISDVGSRFIYTTSKTISEAAARKANITESPTNSLLFSFKLSLGKVSIVKKPMYTNEAIATFLGNDGLVINWAYYAFPVFIPENSKINIYGSPLLNADLINSAKIMVPPVDEQQRIAFFLDNETGRIDTLVNEFIKLKGKLQAQRRSFVSECITKGVPEDRERDYKDSGVEWLGKIPVEWGISKLKSVASCHDNLRKPLNSEQRGHIQGDYPYWGANSIQDYVNDYLVEGETVLLGEDAAPFFDKVKSVAFYTEEKIWPNNHIHVLKNKPEILAKYLTEALNIVDYSAYISGSIRDKLTQGAMMRIVIPLPTLDEQLKIIQYISSEISKINSLIIEIDNQISLLKTYKKSLITEVVTGKVRV